MKVMQPPIQQWEGTPAAKISNDSKAVKHVFLAWRSRVSLDSAPKQDEIEESQKAYHYNTRGPKTIKKQNQRFLVETEKDIFII